MASDLNTILKKYLANLGKNEEAAVELTRNIRNWVVQNGEIVKDMLLNIDNITIDDISLGHLIWDAEYLLDRPQIYQGKEIDHLDRCVNLGWNGTYVLKFTSPFYIWLLEKL